MIMSMRKLKPTVILSNKKCKNKKTKRSGKKCTTEHNEKHMELERNYRRTEKKNINGR